LISIDPKDKTEKENYKLLIGSVIPRPIAFITSLSEKGVLNAAPFSFFNIACSNPPMVSVSIHRDGDKHKDTAINMLKQKEFVLHIVDADNINTVNKTAARLSPDISEVEMFNLTPVKSDIVKVDGLKEAKIRLECVLEQALELGDEQEITCDFIIARVVKYHIDESIYENDRIDRIGLDPISRLAGNSYAKIGEVFDIERPK
jgi:flavin reductase (DIM6/NTAB) family NADH-FMN oxidoreductase RutF